jgi:hypothetical protein
LVTSSVEASSQIAPASAVAHWIPSNFRRSNRAAIRQDILGFPGPVGALLAEFVPEFRETLDDLLAAETDFRSDLDADMGELSSFELLSVFRDSVLELALRGLPQTVDLVARCGQALAAVLYLDHPAGELYREALALRIGGTLDQLDMDRLVTIVPALAALRD